MSTAEQPEVAPTPTDYQGPTQKHPRQLANRLFPWVTGSAIFISLGVLVTLIVRMITQGAPRFNLNMLRWMPSSLPEEAGFQSAFFGTVWIVGITGIICCLVVTLFTCLSRSYFHRRLGGVTGDIIGCTSELAEILALLTIIACADKIKGLL